MRVDVYTRPDGVEKFVNVMALIMFVKDQVTLFLSDGTDVTFRDVRSIDIQSEEGGLPTTRHESDFTQIGYGLCLSCNTLHSSKEPCVR